MNLAFWNQLYFVLLMKSHLESYPCPLIINSFWNVGFLLGITIILQILSGIFLGLQNESLLASTFTFSFRVLSGNLLKLEINFIFWIDNFVFLFIFLHLGRAISYASYFYNPNIWFSGILLFFFLMGTAFMGYVLPFGQMSFWVQKVSP